MPVMQSLWMVVASFFFALMGVCVKLSSEAFAPAEIVFYRSLIALVLIFGIVRLRGIPIVTRHWKFQLSRSASGFVSLALYFYTLTLLPLATAVTLSYTSPLFLAIFLAVFGKMELRGGMLGALALGFSGVVLLLHPTWRADQLLGGVLGLGSGLVAGLSYFNLKELGLRGENEERTVFYFALLSTVASGFWVVLSGLHRVDWRGGLLLFGTAAFGTIAQLAMTRAYKRGNTLVSASLAYLTVVFACLWGGLIWNETLTADSWLAILLIIASGLAATRFAREGKARAGG